MADISRKAVVEKGAKIAKGVRVGAFSYIGPNVKIAQGCVIENNSTILGHTTLQADTHVFPMAVVGAGDGGAKDGRCDIGQAGIIREHVTIHAGTDKPTKIGKNNLIMIASHVGAGATILDHGIFANCTHIGAGANVHEYVRTSGFSLIADGVTVGAYTFVAGYASVDRDAPPFAMVQGFPFRIRGVNIENLQRCGFGEDDIRALKQAFRELFNGPNSPAHSRNAERLLSGEKVNPHVRRLVEFLRGQHGGRQNSYE